MSSANPEIVSITKEAALASLRKREVKDNEIAAQKGFKPYSLLNVEINDGTDPRSSGYFGWYYVTLAVDGKILTHLETGLAHDIASGKVSEVPTREKYFTAGGLKDADVDYIFNNVGFSSTVDMYSLPISDAARERAEDTLKMRESEQSATPAPEIGENAVGAETGRDTAETSEPTIREQYDKYKPMVISAVTEDTAYRNACGHSDRENAVIEGNAAVRRAVLHSGDNDRDSALWTAEQLNALGKLCKPYGFKAVTHNHTGEFMFNEKDGEYCWETVAKNTDPDLVSFKLDIGWASIAGVDCAYLIRKYAGRVELVHVKPATKIFGTGAMNTRKLGFGSKDPGAKQVAPPSMADVGAIMKHVAPAQGPMKDYVFNLQGIMETAESCGAKAFILERDCFYTDRVQVMREDAEFIRTFW